MLSREGVIDATQALINEMKSQRFLLSVKSKILEPAPPATGDELIDRFEAAQAQFFDQHYAAPANNYGAAAAAAAAASASEDANNNNNNNSDNNNNNNNDANANASEGAEGKSGRGGGGGGGQPQLTGQQMMACLQEAVVKFPGDAAVEAIVTELCDLTEKQLAFLVANLQPLEHLRGNNNGCADPNCSDPTHTHSGGAAAGTGNSNNNNSSTPGGAATPAAMMQAQRMQQQMMSNPAAVQAMQQAMATLTPEQRGVLERVQATMAGGSPPAPEDMRSMFLIQQQINAYMMTMQRFSGRGGGAPRGGRGRGRGRGN